MGKIIRLFERVRHYHNIDRGLDNLINKDYLTNEDLNDAVELMDEMDGFLKTLNPDTHLRRTVEYEAINDEKKGDELDNLDACDYYFTAIFEYAALENEEDANRVKDKFDKHQGHNYHPISREMWSYVERCIFELNSIEEYDPQKILEEYFDTSYSFYEDLMEIIENYR